MIHLRWWIDGGRVIDETKETPSTLIRTVLSGLQTNLSRNILTVYLAEFQDFPSDKEIFYGTM